MDKIKLREYGDFVEREVATITSNQPRFSQNNDLVYSFFEETYYESLKDLIIPAYNPDSRARDKVLREFVRKEPHLSGVLNQVVSIDANRSWSITGPEEPVMMSAGIIKNWNPREILVNGKKYLGAADGYRRGVIQQAQSYYSTDMGSITEVGRDKGGLARAFWSTDSARCCLTGDNQWPLQYHPYQNSFDGIQKWSYRNFFRVCSMPSDDEKFNGLGFCAVSRAVEIAKLMIGVLRHDQEKLGARAPRGILLLSGITEDQWQDAMESRSGSLDSKNQKYFNNIMVLASGDYGDPDAKIVALSQLPDNFDIKVTTDLIMWAYALVFGYDPIEFWPVSSGVLGRGKESDIQQKKATRKGGLNFILNFQDEIQKELPDTVHFEFDQQDTEGEILDVELKDKYSKMVSDLVDKQLLQIEEGRSLLAEFGIMPHEWTVMSEDVVTTDTMTVSRELSYDRVIRGMNIYPDSPIVKYRFNPLTNRSTRITIKR